MLGRSLRLRGDFARAEAEFDTALRLAPNAAEILTFYTGWASIFGEAERGADMVERVERLYPDFPLWAAEPFAYAYFMAGRYEAALEMIDRLTPDNHTLALWAMHPAALAAAGRREEARDWVAKAVAARPDLSIETMANAPGHGDGGAAALRRDDAAGRLPALRRPGGAGECRGAAAPAGVRRAGRGVAVTGRTRRALSG